MSILHASNTACLLYLSSLFRTCYTFAENSRILTNFIMDMNVPNNYTVFMYVQLRFAVIFAYFSKNGGKARNAEQMRWDESSRKILHTTG